MTPDSSHYDVVSKEQRSFPGGLLEIYRVQGAFFVGAGPEILLHILTQGAVLVGDLSHERVVFFEVRPRCVMVVVCLLSVPCVVDWRIAALTELHSRNTRIIGGTDAEATHASIVEVERAVREQMQEEPVVISSIGICYVLAVIAVAGDAVRVQTVLCAEPRMSERAVKTSARGQPATQAPWRAGFPYS